MISVIFRFIIRNAYLLFTPISGTELLSPWNGPVIRTKGSLVMLMSDLRSSFRWGAGCLENQPCDSQASTHFGGGDRSWRLNLPPMTNKVIKPPKNPKEQGAQGTPGMWEE